MSAGLDALDDVSDLDDPRWTTVLERVLDGHGLSVVAQPIIDVAHSRVGGFELLSRFAGPPNRTPDVWFTAARRRGLDGELTALTIRRMRELAATRPEATFWTMNVEPHLLTDPVVRAAICGHGRLDGAVVELTEHVEATDDAGVAQVLADVRALGGRVAMDDAGTGYSGLAQMLRIRPEIVKLDRSLVSGLDRDPVRRATVRLLGDLTGQMDAWLLAEGVETRAELTELAALGVPLVQGWVVGRPAPGWPAMTHDSQTVLDEQAVRSDVGDHVLALVRPATVHVRRDGPDGRDGGAGQVPVAFDHVLDGPARAVAGDVVVDPRGRPTAVVLLDPAGCTHEVPALVVAPSSAPHEVLQRAMARTAAWQHAPVVCTDPRGAVLGTITVAALVDHVVAARTAT